MIRQIQESFKLQNFETLSMMYMRHRQGSFFKGKMK